jgi:hypothetical protein
MLQSLLVFETPERSYPHPESLAGQTKRKPLMAYLKKTLSFSEGRVMLFRILLAVFFGFLTGQAVDLSFV